MEQKFRQMDLNFMLARAGRRAPMILPTIELMTHKTDYMKAVLNTVSRNEYTHYFTIKDDFPNFYDELWKLNTAIPLYLTTKEKFNRNKKGLPVVTIMGWFDRSEPRNDGLHDLKGELTILFKNVEDPSVQHLLPYLHQLKNPKTRFTITGYELIMLPRKELPPSWTYRMTAKTKEKWHEDVQNSIRNKQLNRITAQIHSLRRVPPLRGIRKDAYSVINKAKNEWKRTFKDSEPCPFDAIRLPYAGKFYTAEKKYLYGLDFLLDVETDNYFIYPSVEAWEELKEHFLAHFTPEKTLELLQKEIGMTNGNSYLTVKLSQTPV